jgi:hypothetical protein
VTSKDQQLCSLVILYAWMGIIKRINVSEMLTGAPPYDYDTEGDSKCGDDDKDNDDDEELDEGDEEDGDGDDDNNDVDEEDEKLFNKIITEEVDFPDNLSRAAISLGSKASVITIESEALKCTEIEIMQYVAQHDQ